VFDYLLMVWRMCSGWGFDLSCNAFWMLCCVLQYGCGVLCGVFVVVMISHFLEVWIVSLLDVMC